MSRIREAPTCMPLALPFLSRVNQTTYPCTSKWSLYSGCIGRLVAGRCLRNALSPSTTRLRDAPASSLNQSPLNDARSPGVGFHSGSGTKRLTSLSESTVSADDRIAALIEGKFQLVAADNELPASHWHEARATPSRHPFSITNLAGACVFSFRQIPTNFLSSSSETLTGSRLGFRDMVRRSHPLCLRRFLQRLVKCHYT